VVCVEAGLFPGVTYYISLWYPRSQQSKRIAIFFSAATIAGAFGGLLACVTGVFYLDCLHANETTDMASKRWKGE
jgi:MFS family permease